ncbi:MAG: ABC transporter ATP-binding protein [Butyricicoccus pullicaecorum]|nr:ABC transporter ATP-binding protein [Butyricicoccus pullicaecorum]
MIRMENICKIYEKGGVCALDHVALSVASGSYTAILGASGSGKSTLMHILGLLDRPTSGEYWLCGERTTSLSARARAELSRSHIGFVFQNFSLVPGMSALENAALPLAFRGMSRAERTDRAAEALCIVGLGARLHHTPRMLSGGQQQRVAIARALCTGSDLILADEPTGNLDPQAAREILELFDRLHAQGRTILWITHDHQAAARAQKRVLMQKGRLCPE